VLTASHVPRQALAALPGLLSMFVMLAAAGPPNARLAGAAAPLVTISQVYGGGGNSGATYTHDFIELYNRGDQPVSLDGWSLQYTSAAGTTWQITPLSGAIAPGGYFLVQQAQGTGGTLPLPAPDVTGTVALNASAGKVALANTSAALAGACPLAGPVVDFAGYGSTANCFEGSGPTATLSNTTAALRKDGGATDTDDNAADFDVGPPNPRNSAFDQAPFVAAFSPAHGSGGNTAEAAISVTFSEPVDLADGWFSIVCQASGSHTASVAGGPQTFTLTPAPAFSLGQNCTVTILAGHVSDQDELDPPDQMDGDHSWHFFVGDRCDYAFTPIYTLQGSGSVTPLLGQFVSTRGVLVGEYTDNGSLLGFFLQDPSGDEDPETSDGIFIFAPGAAGLSRGQAVNVAGTASEFNNLTQLAEVTDISVCGAGPAISPAEISLPMPAAGYFERYEGMLVRLSGELYVTEHFGLGRFGEVALSAGGRLFNPTHLAEPGPAAVALQAENDLRRLVLDDGSNAQNRDPVAYPQGGLSYANTLRTGDRLTEVIGVLDERFGGYRLQPVGQAVFESANPRPAAPPPVGGRLRLASFNVLNYFNGDGQGGGFPTSRGANTVFEFERQRAKILSALADMDAAVVGLMEIENDLAGPHSALADLVAGLNERLGAGAYAYVETGVIGTDEIKVALIYQPGLVSPVGGYALLDSSVDARFNDSRNRPALAQTFVENSTGLAFTVVVNHLKSKGSACTPDDPDLGDGQGNCNGTRTLAAQALADWLAGDPTGAGSGRVLILGDLNAYAKEDPIRALEAAGYTNLLAHYQGAGAYSYVFQGQAGYLDHALASAGLAGQVTGAAAWHINADEPIYLDYNVEFKSANHVETLYDPGPFRASDHDPVLVGLSLTADLGYDFDGFYPPVANPPAFNKVRAGAAVALNFSLGGDFGLDVIAVGYPRSEPIECGSVPDGQGIESASGPGGSALSYDPDTGQYTYVWKTEAAWRDTCRQFVLLLVDGSVHRANFDFRR
jgi:uncharacterized protein